MKTWKAKEKQLTEWLTEWGPWPAERMSRALRGERVEDVAWGPFSVELKTRKSFPPRYLEDWLEQAQANSDGKVPIVVAHKDGMRRGQQIVCMTLEDWTFVLHELAKYGVEWYQPEDKGD